MTIRLPEDLESTLRAEVESGRFAAADDAVALIVREYFQHRGESPRPEPPAAGDAAATVPVWERIIETMRGVPDEVFDRIPADSSEQLDHYLYGAVKRPTSCGESLPAAWEG